MRWRLRLSFGPPIDNLAPELDRLEQMIDDARRSKSGATKAPAAKKLVKR